MGRLAPWGHALKVSLLSGASISPNRAQTVQNGSGNGPRPWVPKMQKMGKREGVSTPKPYGREVWLGPHLCPSEDLTKRPEKRKEKLGPPAAPRHPAEEKGAASSTRLLVTLRHHRKLGDAPTYKIHQGNGEKAKRRGERGRRTGGEGAHRQ